MSARSGERGAALVVTLIFAAAMAAAAVAFLEARRSDSLALRAQVQAVEAETLLRAALLETGTLLANRTNRQQIPPQLQFAFGDARVTVQIEPENAKVDLNSAEEPLLQALSVALGLSSDAAKAVAEAILDWRDENSERRPYGAESRDYDRARQGSSGAANRPLASTAELRYLPPVDPALWARLEPLVTIYTGAPTPNPLKASPPVRRALAIARGLSGQKDRMGAGTAGSGATSDGGSAMGSQGGLSTGGSGFGAGGSGSGGLGSGSSTGGLSGGSGGLGGSGGSGLSSGGGLGGRGSGLGGSSGLGAGLSSTVPGTSLGGGTQTADTGQGQAGNANANADSGGPQNLSLTVRFPNGYEAGARAVIAVRPQGGGGGAAASRGNSSSSASAPPFAVLDWAPVLRPSAAPSGAPP